MKIKKADDIRTPLTTWAKANKAKVHDADGAVIIAKGDWSIEVRPEDGWAYLHGNGSLGGISTNIASIDEFDGAVKRLTGDK